MNSSKTEPQEHFLFKLIVDSSIIASCPNILDLKSQNYFLRISYQVYFDFKKGYLKGIKKSRRDFICKKIESRLKEDKYFLTECDNEIGILKGSLNNINYLNNSLSTSEISLLAIALSSSNYSKPIIVTDNDKIINYCRTQNIETNSLHELLLIYSREMNTPYELLRNDVYYGYKPFFALTTKIVLAIALSIVSYIIYSYLQYLLPILSNVVIIACGIIISIFLFFLRERVRLTYAILEIIVGVFTLNLFISSFESVTSFTTILKLFSGIYIIVRGLDNVAIALKEIELGRYILYKLKIKR